MRHPDWLTVRWWRRPVGAVYFTTLVLSLGKGAWYTCWALFFIRSIGLSPAQLGVGVTVAGLVGLFAGGPLGYLADRVGPREMLIALGAVHAIVMFSFAVVYDFWVVMTLVCVMMAVDRSIAGIRIAVISGLTCDHDRLKGVSTNHVMKEGGAAVGAIFGALVLSLDTRGAYQGMVVAQGIANIVFVLVLLRWVPHVRSLSDRKIKRGVLVLRDRPFLAITLCNGLLALNWGMLDSGVPLWITTHTHAPFWVWGLLMAFNGLVIMTAVNRVTQAGRTVPGAGRLGLWSGVVLAACCALFAATAHGSGAVVVAVLGAAAAVHVVGELFAVGSGFGLSVGLTPAHAHGEYQGLFTTGQTGALMIAPALMTALLVAWGVPGWFALAGLYLVGGAGTILAARWALRVRQRSASAPPSAPSPPPSAPIEQPA